MTENSTERHALRKTLLKNGYTPLPLASKGVFIKGWSRADVDSAWLLRWKRHAKYPNTGIRCDNVIAFDIDVLDEALADECEAIVEDECGPTELCRIGQWPKRLLLYRLDGEMGRSARTGKYGGHMVELLHGNGRQFAAFGKHPGTGQPYYWESDSPADIQLADLTSISADRALEVLDVLDDYLADTGLPQERRAYARGAHGAQAWDLMPDTIVDYEGTRIAWRDLRDQLTEEGGFGNLYRPEYEAFGDSSAVHFYLAHGTLEPCAHDFVHDCTHWESTYRPDFAALLPPPPAKKSANQFVHPDIADLEENCVILRDQTVRRLTRPHRSYPLTGFVRSYQHLQVPHPNPPASKPNALIAFTKLWEQAADTLKADYAALRPDRPDDRIIVEAGERILNTFRWPDHADASGETATFYEFVGHLLPKEKDRGIFLDWFAHKVANPGDRMHGMVMIAPNQGTGRGTMVQIFERIFGEPYIKSAKLSEITGHGSQSAYNDYLADSLVVNVEEALERRPEQTLWAARRESYEHIKTILNPVASGMRIRRKYGLNTEERIFSSLFITSNHRDALAIEPDDRRLIVLDNTDVRLVEAPDRLYERIQAWKDVPANIGALVESLRERALESHYDAFGIPPMTYAKERMIDAGQSDTDWVWMLFTEQCPGDIVTPAQWRTFVQQCRVELDVDLPPVGQPLDRAITAVISTRARRIDSLPKSGQMKVKGTLVRPWVIRNFELWCETERRDLVAAEIEKNGPVGHTVIKLPRGPGERDDADE
jgi:hypothetical protein